MVSFIKSIKLHCFIIIYTACDLLKKMLRKDPKERISATEALHHPWIETYAEICPETSILIAPNNIKECFEKYIFFIISYIIHYI